MQGRKCRGIAVVSAAGVEMIAARADFLAARKGRRLNGPHFFVETRQRCDTGPPRLGLTVTKKIGNAVVRNRIKRRLRAAVRTSARDNMIDGTDYVVVARRDMIDLPFDVLTQELSRRLSRLKDAGSRPSTTKRRSSWRPSGSD